MNPELIFEKTFSSLLAGGWLKQFHFTDNKGWHLVWTETGAQRAMELKRVISECGLSQDDRAPMAFTILAQSGGLGGAWLGEYDPEAGRIWLAALHDLGIPVNDDDLLGLVHSIIGWVWD